MKLRSKRKYIPTHPSPFILDVVVVCVCVCAGARPLCLTESQDKQKVLAALVSSTSRFLKKKQEEVIDGGGGQPMYRSNRAVHRHCCALPFQLRGQNNFLERILPFSPPLFSCLFLLLLLLLRVLFDFSSSSSSSLQSNSPPPLSWVV